MVVNLVAAVTAVAVYVHGMCHTDETLRMKLHGHTHLADVLITLRPQKP